MCASIKDMAGDRVTITICGNQADVIKVLSDFSYPEGGTYMIYTAKQAKRLEKALRAARKAMEG